MHSFVIVASRPQRRIPAHVLARLHEPDGPDICFVPDDHLVWSDAAERVIFAGWQASRDVVAMGSQWHRSERGVTAFAGRLWPKGGMWRADRSWASQLEEHWRAHPAVGPDQRLDGLFAATSIATTGEGVIVTDPLSIAMVYRAADDDCVAYATSAGLAARVVAPPDRDPDRDLLTVAWLPFIGNIVGDRTGFIGTTVLPLGSYVEIHPAYGSRVRFSNPTPWAGGSDLPPVEQELVDLVHDDLSRAVRSIAELPARQRLADITGGRDSRLVLALMIEAGITDKFRFRTTGMDHAPDAVVGRAIAERFGLAHDAIVPAPLDHSDFGQRLRTHVFHTSGMLSAWDFKGALNTATAPKITGMPGELLRTHYKGYPYFASVDELRNDFHRWQKLDALSLLQPDVRAALVELLNTELLEQVVVGGSSPQDLLDSFYVRHRLRRWFGTTEELGESGRVYPLYSLLGLQAAFAVGSEKRWSESLVFSIMRSASSELTAMPLAKSGWEEELFARLPDAAAYGASPVKYSGREPVQWQPSRLEANRDIVEGYLLDETSSPLYDIIDRHQIERVLRGGVPTGQQQPQALFGALTAAVWIGRHESRLRIGGTADEHEAPDTTRHGSGSRAV